MRNPHPATLTQVYIPPLGSVSYLEDRPKRQSLSEMMM